MNVLIDEAPILTIDTSIKANDLSYGVYGAKLDRDHIGDKSLEDYLGTPPEEHAILKLVYCTFITSRFIQRLIKQGDHEGFKYFCDMHAKLKKVTGLRAPSYII